MKYLPIVCFFHLSVFAARAQRNDDAGKVKDFSNAAGLTIATTVESFKRTHSAGIAAEYMRSNNLFGLNALVKTRWRFLSCASVAFFPGKTVLTGGYPFTYGNYLIVYFGGGIDYKPSGPFNFNLNAGPLGSYYKKGWDLGFGLNLAAGYAISTRISTGPVLAFRKIKDVDPLWSAGARLLYAF
jgi:hypothetical protein